MIIVFKSKEVLTRKVHYCWGCGDKFKKKSILIKTDIKDQGDVFSQYWCKYCNDFLLSLKEETFLEKEMFINHKYCLKSKLTKLIEITS